MTTDKNQNVWFGISMGLLGLIVGFVIATVANIPAVRGVQQVAQIPTPPNAPVANPPAAPPAQPQPAGTIAPLDFNRDHFRGNKNATVAVIEYSDFQCPYCQRVHPTYKQIMQEYGDKVVWVYRHFPLVQLHPNARPAAIASECIYEQGGNDAFWKFADIVFEQGNFDYAAIAKQIGMDDKKLTACIASGKYDKYVDDQETTGSTAGVNGTPGNIVYNVKTKNSRLAPGARSFEMFKTDIDAMLADK